MSSENKIEVLKFDHPLYHFNEKTPIGRLSKLALVAGAWEFEAKQVKGELFSLSHDSGIVFQAQLKEGRGPKRGTYQIKGCINTTSNTFELDSAPVNLNGAGASGKTLRTAQLGAIHSLLSHWSLSNEAATVVLPTGTGKTETMLVTSLIDKSAKTLVIVPTVDLKVQIAAKFASLGMLRELKVIENEVLNPLVLVLSKTITELDYLNHVELADVVVTTPAFIARAPSEVKTALKDMFAHVYFDEAHHVVAKEWNILKTLFDKSKIVQFTATPYRNDRRPIEGKIVYNYPLSKALADNCFAKISLVAVDERHPRKKDKAIADAAMERLISDRNQGFDRHKMMVRGTDINHANELYQKYKVWYPNERIALIHGKVTQRRQRVQAVKEGEFDIVVCVDMLREGFDYPDFKIAAVHGMHKSLAVLLQFIGRFTRTQSGLGDASFVVNYADSKISVELESLFQEGSGWEQVIKEIADAKKDEAETLLSFLQDCTPYIAFDSPDIKINPKLVYPALSCVCYSCESVNWFAFAKSFNKNKYAISKPYINEKENVFYFSTQKREKVKWARTNDLRNQTWDLIVMHFDVETNILYIGYSEKRLDLQALVNSISSTSSAPLNGDMVFRSFDAIKRLSIVHAGIFKPANHLHRYSRLSGADVTTELSRWKAGNRCQKSDFVGIGFRDGFPVSVGASVKGKMWSPARVGDLLEWKTWCTNIGRMITDESIDSNQLLEESAEKHELAEYPESAIVLASDWSESLYDRIHKLTLDGNNTESLLLSEATLKCKSCAGCEATFELIIIDKAIPFSILLGGDKGHAISGLDKCGIFIEGLKNEPVPLDQFFQENPPTLFLINGSTISGCVYTDYGQAESQSIPESRIETLPWERVDFKKESLYKSSVKRRNTIQEYMMKKFVKRGYQIVFNDDNSGESADIVAIHLEEDLVRFELIHCKYSASKESGSRKSDLYEVCGQAIISLRYKWNPEELLRHLLDRDGKGVLKGKRFYHGTAVDVHQIKEALKHSEVSFEFAIAQPGVDASEMTTDMKLFLGSIYSTVVEMTETELRCYFS